ncbi:MAG: CDP-glycerol glycerophosphotransferase family protein [Polyangia bacterium]
MINGLALNLLGRVHFLDHFAPICEALDLPMIVCEEVHREVAARYYPGLRIDVIPKDQLSADDITSRYDVLFQSQPSLAREAEFIAAGIDASAAGVPPQWRGIMEALTTRGAERARPITWVFCPHGYSGKPSWLKRSAFEQVTLVYGDAMMDRYRELGLTQYLGQTLAIGNQRLGYYERHRVELDALVAEECKGHLRPGARTIMYAPTWNEGEGATSFFSGCELLLKTLPDEHNLIVKLHPLMTIQSVPDVVRLKERHQDRPNVLFLAEHPLVYPLLSLCDVFVGDTSSVGYDFLSFDRPMFFLNQQHRDMSEDHELYLFRCGTVVTPDEYPQLFSIIDRGLATDREKFGSMRAEAAKHVFAPTLSPAQLRVGIEEAVANARR